ncbi:MAG: Holliday junction resolvase RuvX [Rhodospirillaceae bacterium]
MAIMDIKEISGTLGRNARLIGIDLGTKTIGLALSDVERKVASPLTVLARGKFTRDSEALFALMDEHGAASLILGLPVSMDGREGPRCQSTRQFAQNLLARRDMPVAFWDERLSTAAVVRMLVDDVDMTRGRRAQVVDKLAATYILQGALDAIN